MAQLIDRRLSVAPMMAHTDRHFRYLLRLISKRVMLYTEMITSGALIHGDLHKHLHFNHAEHPVAIQLAGNTPRDLAKCAQIVEDYGYDELNLNVGCPSDRGKSGRFGACLMLYPDTVAACVKAMQASCHIPVTVKSRIGVDANDSDEELHTFIEKIAHAGCKTFIIHARKAWLSGLSPRQNREIPPLAYARVYQLKNDFPELEIIINGGIIDLAQTEQHLSKVDGVMIGRAICHNPWLLATADNKIFGLTSPASQRHSVIRDYMDYMQQQLSLGTSLYSMSRHMLGLYHGQAGAKAFRRHLSEHAHKQHAGIEVVENAIALVNAA